MQTIEDRLERLESQNLRLRTGLILTILAGAAAVLLGSANEDPIPDLVQARAFHLVGKNGAVLVKLHESADTGRHHAEGIGAGEIALFDSESQKLVTLGGDGEEPSSWGGFVTIHHRSSVNAGMWTGEFGGGIVEARAGKAGARLTTWLGRGGVETFEDHELLVRVGQTLEGGGGMISVRNGNRGEVVHLGARGNGEGVLVIRNSELEELVKLGETLDGQGAVATFGTSAAHEAKTLTPCKEDCTVKKAPVSDSW
jgi:hypothetical protein